MSAEGAEGTSKSDAKKEEESGEGHHQEKKLGTPSDKLSEAASELLPGHTEKAANSLEQLLTADEKHSVTSDDVESGAIEKAALESPIEAIVNWSFGEKERQMAKEEEEKVEEEENERIKETPQYEHEIVAANNIEESDPIRTLQMTQSEIASDISQSIEHQYEENPEARTAAELRDYNLQDVGGGVLTDSDRQVLLRYESLH